MFSVCFHELRCGFFKVLGHACPIKCYFVLFLYTLYCYCSSLTLILSAQGKATCCECIQVWCEICGRAYVGYNTIWLYVACWTDNLNKVICNWPTGMVWTALFKMCTCECVCEEVQKGEAKRSVGWPRPTHRYDSGIGSSLTLSLWFVLHFTALYLRHRHRGDCHVCTTMAVLSKCVQQRIHLPGQALEFGL